MEKNNSELIELKDILIWFIKEQKDFNNKIEKKIDNLENFNEEQKIFNEKIEKKIDNLENFNEEQKVFNEEQKIFNDKIEKKIDKAQYFLEETIATNIKILFEEQIELKTEMEGEIKYLKNDLSELTLKVNHIFKSNLLS